MLESYLIDWTQKEFSTLSKKELSTEEKHEILRDLFNCSITVVPVVMFGIYSQWKDWDFSDWKRFLNSTVWDQESLMNFFVFFIKYFDVDFRWELKSNLSIVEDAKMKLLKILELVGYNERFDNNAMKRFQLTKVDCDKLSKIWISQGARFCKIGPPKLQSGTDFFSKDAW